MELKQPLYTALRLLSFCFLCIAALPAYAQNYTISGTVKDAKTGEALISASIYVKELHIGVVTNAYGFYSLSMPKGKHVVSFIYTGYTTVDREIDLEKDMRLNVELSEKDIEMKEVVITGKKPDENVKDVGMSKVDVDISTIKKMPAFMGEVDVLKSIQLLPGVQTGGEGSSGFYVRGGGADQNLILLDGAPVFNASHLLGFFSVFNADAVQNVELYKGGIPAAYGGRLSSILDVTMREGNSKNFHVSGGIGLIASRLTLEGPIVKDKGSFLITGRRTYADMFLKLSPKSSLNKSSLYFYDLNLKANYNLNDNNRIFLSGYFGRDKFGFADIFGIGWGNYTATARWNHIYSSRLFSNLEGIYSKYDYRFDITLGQAGFVWKSGLTNISPKLDYTFYLNAKNTIRFGAIATHYTFNPGSIIPGENSFFNPMVLPNQYAWEEGIYISNDQTVSKKLSIQYGLRYSMFQDVGPGLVYHYDVNNNYAVYDSTRYGNGKIIKSYGGLEPRLAGRYVLDSSSSIKVSYNHTYQYLQLLSNTNATTSTDIWVPSSPNILPQMADQGAGGYFRNFLQNTLETSVELYYKKMEHQVDFKDNAQLMLNPKVEGELRFGTGDAYGIEFFVRKSLGKFNGWISYTLSKTERTIIGINNNQSFPPRWDRRHNLAVVLSYDISREWNLSANWVYNTGAAVSMPQGRYQIGGQNVPFYTSRNGYRLPDYHRLDLSATYKPHEKPGKRFHSSWNFSIYNAYDRYNTYAILFQQDPDNPNKTQAVRLSLFGIIPSATWNFNF